jgi:hypothetical protein
MLEDEIEEKNQLEKDKKTQVNWVNLPNPWLKSWDQDNFIENIPK